MACEVHAKSQSSSRQGQPSRGRFWRFPNISEERKRVVTCIMQGWAGKAELRRKQPESFFRKHFSPFSVGLKSFV